MRWFPCLFLLVSAAAQEFNVPCEPTPEFLRHLEKLPPIRDYSYPYEARIGPLRDLAEKNPDDLFVQLAYQNAFRDRPHLAAEYDRALGMYRRRPANPLSRYLEARLLMLASPKASRATFEELLSRYPRFVWPHLDYLLWNQLPGRRETKEAETHLRAFLAACPAAIEGYSQFELVRDPELIRSAAEGMRAALQRRDSALDVALWPQLWALESRALSGPKAAQDRVRADLKRFDSPPFLSLRGLGRVYQEAAQLLSEPSILAGFEARVERLAPQSPLMLDLVQARWRRENPSPGSLATLNERNLYRVRQAEARARWLERWPDDCGLNLEEWLQIIPPANQPSMPLERAMRVADAMLWCHQQMPDAFSFTPPFEVSLAGTYVGYAVRLDQVPRLLDIGLKAPGEQQKYRLSGDLLPPELRARASSDSTSLTDRRIQTIRAGYFLASKRPADARALAEQELGRLESSRPAPDAPRAQAATGQVARTEWQRLLAKAAEAEGNLDEALDMYRASLDGISRETLASARSSAVSEIKNLYLVHGGTEDKWLDWATSGSTSPAAPTGPPAPQFSQPLADFSAKDLAGRLWDRKALLGRGTFVNYWATWCGPCRGEHPDLQKLYDMTRDRKDVQVLTVSVDENPAVLSAYLKEKGYTFPVIHDTNLADRLFPYVGLPTNYLVNADGIRSGMYAFLGGNQGLTRAISDLEQAATRR